MTEHDTIRRELNVFYYRPTGGIVSVFNGKPGIQHDPETDELVSFREVRPGEIMLTKLVLAKALLSALKRYEQEMEGYSYFGSNPGVPKDDYQEVINDVLAELFPEGTATKGEKG